MLTALDFVFIHAYDDADCKCLTHKAVVFVAPSNRTPSVVCERFGGVVCGQWARRPVLLWTLLCYGLS